MEKYVKNLIGERIKNARNTINMTQAALAEKVSLSEEQIGALELGKFLPEVEDFIKILGILDINENEICITDSNSSDAEKTVQIKKADDSGRDVSLNLSVTVK